MKLRSLKGFTLAELLIVMAIIVVLAAVAIPSFTRQLETSRETADLETLRNAYTEAYTFALADVSDNGKLDKAATTANVTYGNIVVAEVSGQTAQRSYQVTGLKFVQSYPGFEYVSGKLDVIDIAAVTGGSVEADGVASKIYHGDNKAAFIFQVNDSGALELVSITTSH